MTYFSPCSSNLNVCPIIRKSKSLVFVLQLVPRFSHGEQLVCVHVWGSQGYLIYRFTGVLRATVVEINEYRSHVPTVERERVPGLHYRPVIECMCVCFPGTALAFVTLALQAVIRAMGADATEKRRLMQLLEWRQLTHCTWSHYCREREKQWEREKERGFCAGWDSVKEIETIGDRKCRSVTQVDVIFWEGESKKDYGKEQTSVQVLQMQRELICSKKY